jgi:hypothetical protein
MESLFDSIGALLGGVFGLAQGGFDSVNQIVGLLIAVIATLMMPAWRSLWGTALGAALVHILIGVLRPVLDGGALVLPNLLSLTFWMTVLALFLGYAIVIAVFFLIKSLLTGGLGRRRHAH